MHRGMCSHRPAPLQESEERFATSTPTVRRGPNERTTDADRQRAAQMLSRAFGDGLLLPDEVEERLSRVYEAVTVGDLAAVTADLPADLLAAVEREERQRRRRLAREQERRGEIGGYLRLMAILLSVWLATAVFAGAWYPWPIWPALGWGVPLFMRGRRDRTTYLSRPCGRPGLEGRLSRAFRSWIGRAVVTAPR